MTDITFPAFDELVSRVEALEAGVKAEAAAVNVDQLALVDHPPVSAPSPAVLSPELPRASAPADSEEAAAHVPVADPTTAGGPGGATDEELDAERARQVAEDTQPSDTRNATPPSDPTSTLPA